MSSVALVGFGPLTYYHVKETDTDEFWTLNHAIFVTDIPRIDRLFEIHRRSWYLRGEQEKSDMYDKWLRELHDFPIYMQEDQLAQDLVPSGVKYPFEEVCEELLPGLIRKIGAEELKMVYFTSTAAFMLALAIYEGFDEIHLVGIDADSDTEYSYQKPGIEFWIGVALGRGIRVIIQEECNLCTAPIYGYEVVPYIDKMNINAYLKLYQEKRKLHHDAMDEAVRGLTADPENEKHSDIYLRESAWVYLYDGAITACSRFIQYKDAYVSRQYLEIQKTAYQNSFEEHKSKVTTLQGQMALAGKDKTPVEVWKAYLDGRASMYANQGALQLCNRLMHVIDFRDVNMDLEMNVVEE